MAEDEPAGRIPASGARGRRAGARSGRRRRWARRAAAILLTAALAPILLTLIYAVPSVHPVSTLMLKDMATGKSYERRWIDLSEVAPVLVASVTMSEDGQFCTHHGVDFGALNEVLNEYLGGAPPRGASTIPMQSVKNLFLWHGRSYLRKALEAPLAIIFDAVLSKPRIMEIYLNIAEWGPGIYGIEAAAQHHFGRSAARLTARQAALLAATLPNPHTRTPANPDRTLDRLATVIQRRAARAGSHVACLTP